ncbi:Fanconi anemia group J protein [Aphelenchoides fujianensis]|nr:Fanconi anemia group J protein [Aphelenchoides fujianensis]
MLVDVEGIRVDFPYEPYECQTLFMRSVIAALTNKQNAILESPTGTGKTLSLLCSTLAYVRSLKEKFVLDLPNMQTIQSQGTSTPFRSFSLPFQIIYASRTHSQLKQVVRELNKTIYKSSIKVAFLAGREQLCLNDRVQKEANSNAKSQICRTLIHSQRCHFYNKLSQEDPFELQQIYATENDGNVMDIEDLVAAGKKMKHCPFFRMRKTQPTADLVLLPYNYILDPKIRETYQVKLAGNILIFDEAHNLGNIAEESISMSLSTATVGGCIHEAKFVIEAMMEDVEEKRVENETANVPLHILERQQKQGGQENEKELPKLQRFEEVLDGFWTKPPKNQAPTENLSGRVFPGETLVGLFAQAGIYAGNAPSIGLVIDRVGIYWMKREAEKGHGGAMDEKIAKLPEFAAFISRVFALGIDVSMDQSIYDLFRLYVTEVEGERNGFVMNYWCFSPRIAMRILQGKHPHSMLLASGTLSPLPNFIESMGISFLYTLENKHAAKSSQVLVRPIRQGVNRTELLGTFQNRENPTYIHAVGEIVHGVATNVPQGILVFFPSYSQMTKFLNAWKTNLTRGQSRWSSLQDEKTLCVEPSKRSETQLAFREFDLAVREGKGAIMFAMSEGIDFADCHCRAVVIVGIPYPPLMDPRVVLKRKFLTDRHAKNKAEMSPDDWYKIEAIRAVNQAMGRIIRHKDDFGIVVLADSRFATFPPHLYPAWLRPSFRAQDDPHRLFAELRRFFGERSASIQRSQQENRVAYQRRRGHVSVEEDRRTREEVQAASFIQMARDYGVELDGAENRTPASSSSAAPKRPNPPSGDEAAAQTKKRKIVKIVRNTNRPPAADQTASSSEKEAGGAKSSLFS